MRRELTRSAGLALTMLLAAGCTGTRRSQRRPSHPPTTEHTVCVAEKALEHAYVFYAEVLGEGSSEFPLEVHALLRIASEPDAPVRFERLASPRFPLACRLYALVGLQAVAPYRGAALLRSPRGTWSGEVDYQWGCICSSQPVAQLLSSGDRERSWVEERAFEFFSKFRVSTPPDLLIREIERVSDTDEEAVWRVCDFVNRLGPAAVPALPSLENRIRSATKETIHLWLGAYNDAIVWAEDGATRYFDLLRSEDLTNSRSGWVAEWLSLVAGPLARASTPSVRSDLFVFEDLPRAGELRDDAVAQSMERLCEADAIRGNRGCWLPKSLPIPRVAYWLDCALSDDEVDFDAPRLLALSGLDGAHALIARQNSPSVDERRSVAKTLRAFLARPSTWHQISPAMTRLASDGDEDVAKHARGFLRQTSREGR